MFTENSTSPSKALKMQESRPQSPAKVSEKKLFPITRLPQKLLMMEEEEETMLPPFWLQSSDTPRLRRLRRRSSSFFLNSGLLLVLLLVAAAFFVFVVIPSFLSFTSQVFKPHLVRKSWDTLNLVLVLFAIACGFLSRNQNNDKNENAGSDGDPSVANASHEARQSDPSTPQRGYEYPDRTASYNTINRIRTSSSYPDLRQESAWVSVDDRWRFHDDTHMSNYRLRGSDQLHHRRPQREPQEEEPETKTIAVDTVVIRREEVSSDLPPQAPSPPSPPPQPRAAKAVKSRTRRTTNQALEHRGKTHIENKEDSEGAKNQLQPPPSPPSPPPPSFQLEEQNSYSHKNEKKRSPGSSATKDFLNSLKRKRKKRRERSVENFDSLLNSQPPLTLPLYPPPSPPPPPPPLPPPPSSVFHNFFSSKKGKTKKVISVPPPPPPPPPPPRRAKAARKPPLPAKSSIFDENVNSGSESPLVPIPPPPPPPPFKLPGWKFVMQGDFVRIKSDTSSRSGSPDLDDGEGDSPIAAVGTDGEDPPTNLMFCPSPDVDTKANSFIERFRANLKLEKMNSLREKQGRGRSNLGPERSPDTV